jgi:predicted RND superfamily exporter protein
VTSLVNARHTRGEGDLLIVGELLEDWPQTREDLAVLRERVFANPLYVDNLISRDARLTTLSIELVTYSGGNRGADEILAGFEEASQEASAEAAEPPLLSEDEKGELVAALWPIVNRYDAADFRLFVVGGAVVAKEITTRMTEDSGTHVSVTALAIVLFLFFLFRRLSGVLYPMIVVAASLTVTLGAMAWLDLPFSLTLAMLPVFVMCVGVCNSIHVLVLVYQRLEGGGTRREAVIYALGHSGLAIVMTSLTTAAGMFSFVFAELAPIRHLGMIAPTGVAFAFLFTMTLLPALIGIFPLRARPRWAPLGDRSRSQSFLMWVGAGAVRHSRAILGATLVLVLVAGVGLTQLRFVHKPLDWFPPDNPVYIAAQRIDRDLRGATTAEVLIDTGRENGLQAPDTLKSIEAATREVETIREGELFVGKAISLVDILEETHQALNANDPAFHRIPDDPALVAQELLLFENSGSDDLERFTDSQFREGRVTLRVPMVNAMLYDPFLARIHEIFTEHLGDQVTLTVTGRSTLRARTFSALVKSMAKSYAFALAVITPLMMMLIGNVRLGLISMAPNLLPVIFTLAAMGLLDIPLDASSMVIGSIVIGLAVDDTIHLMRRFQLEYQSMGDVVGAVREVMCTTGSALFFTTLVLTTGFGVMGSLGSLKNTVYFGYLSALGIALAFVANMLLTPALISLATRLEKRRRS